jgi:hypothetical protein
VASSFVHFHGVPAWCNPRARSLLRGVGLVLAGLALAMVISDFPKNNPSLFLIFPLLLGVYGMFETSRCIQKHWSFYHSAVMISLWMEVMALTMIIFLLLWPYFRWFLK